MGWLDKWNGEDNNCICKYCTPGVPEISFFVGEFCPRCGAIELAEHDKFPEWVFCSKCGFQGRENRTECVPTEG